MTDRKINPALRCVDLYIDESHWLALLSLATKKSVAVDTLVGAILEHFLCKVGELKALAPRENPIKVDVQLEPIREDKQLYDDLLEEREMAKENKNIAGNITEEDTLKFNWHDL